jgi:4-hydroxythreonine-4-phosphate dehydrogenase
VIRKKIETVRKSLIQDFSINKPKIAVLGLNPRVEMVSLVKKMMIYKNIKKIFDKGTLVFLVLLQQMVLGSGQYDKYDAVIATIMIKD